MNLRRVREDEIQKLWDVRSDFESLLDFIENMGDFDCFEDVDKSKISNLPTFKSLDLNQNLKDVLVSILEDFKDNPLSLALTSLDALIKHCTDKESDILEFSSDIQKASDLWDLLPEIQKALPKRELLDKIELLAKTENKS